MCGKEAWRVMVDFRKRKRTVVIVKKWGSGLIESKGMAGLAMNSEIVETRAER